jgi:hypothetical protein
MEFKKDVDPIATSDFWYDLTDGGYIRAEDFLANESDIKTVREAILVLEEFKATLENAGLIEEM